MRTNIEIDDDLMSSAMAACGLPTKRAAVEAGLRILVRLRGQAAAVAELDGVGWNGSLDGMREDRAPRAS